MKFRRSLLLFVVVLAAGCTGSDPSTVTRGVTTATPTATSAAAPASRCAYEALTLRLDGQQGATGHYIAVFQLRNASSKTCVLKGFPVFSLLSARGTVLARASHRGGGFAGFPTESATVRVAPRAAVTFRVEARDFNATQNKSCPMSVRASVIPPGGTHPINALASLPVCGDDFYVSPIERTTG